MRPLLKSDNDAPTAPDYFVIINESEFAGEDQGDVVVFCSFSEAARDAAYEEMESRKPTSRSSTGWIRTKKTISATKRIDTLIKFGCHPELYEGKWVYYFARSNNVPEPSTCVIGDIKELMNMGISPYTAPIKTKLNQKEIEWVKAAIFERE